MITSVCVSGKLKGAINDYSRYVEVEKVAAVENKIVTDLIPVSYINKNPKSHFMRLQDDTFVVIKGRLETMENIGLVVVCEMFEVLTNNSVSLDLDEEY